MIIKNKIIYFSDKFIIKNKNSEFLLSFLITLIFVLSATFLGYSNNKVVPVNLDTHARYVVEPNNPLKILSNWDGPDYLKIATFGYRVPYQTNLFPLYPLTTRIVHKIGPSILDSALIVTWLALFGSVYYFLKVVKLNYNFKDNLKTIRAILLFLFFPTGVFLIGTYSESLLAFFSFSAIYYAYKKEYVKSGLLLALASATHLSGLFTIFIVLIILYRKKLPITKILTTILIGVTGLLGYMLFQLYKFNNPFEFIRSQQHLGWLHWSLTNYFNQLGWMNIIMLTLVLISIFYWWNKRIELALYSIIFLLLPFLSGQFGGYNRYVLMDFSLPLMFFDKFKDSKTIYPILISISAILWSYFLFQYVGGYVGG